MQMVQFERPRVIYPLVLFTFRVHCGVSISLHAGKGKCCIWPVNKVEIHFAKIGFVDCKWSNSNAPGSYTLWCYSLLTFGVHCGVSISLYAGKGKCCIWPVNRVEIHFAKLGFVDCKWSN